MRRLTTLFPSEFLEEHAEELGVVERDRKLQIPAFAGTKTEQYRQAGNAVPPLLAATVATHL